MFLDKLNSDIEEKTNRSLGIQRTYKWDRLEINAIEIIPINTIFNL